MKLALTLSGATALALASTSASAQTSDTTFRYPSPAEISACAIAMQPVNVQTPPPGVRFPAGTREAHMARTDKASCMLVRGNDADNDPYTQFSVRAPGDEQVVSARRITTVSESNQDFDTVETTIGHTTLGAGILRISNVGAGAYFESFRTGQNQALPTGARGPFGVACDMSPALGKAMQGSLNVLYGLLDRNYVAPEQITCERPLGMRAFS